MGLRSWLRGDDLWQGRTRYTPGLNTPALGSIAGGMPPKSAIPTPGIPPDQMKPGKQAGRVSRPTTTTILGSMAWLPRQHPLATVDTLDLTKFTPEQIIEVLSNSSPELAMAAWNFVRLANSGWGITVKKMDRTTDDPEAYKIVMDFLDRVNAAAGGVDTLIDSLHLMAYLEGAVAIEAPPIAGLKGVEDIYPVRPASVRFRWLNIGTQDKPEFVLAMMQWVLSMHAPIYLNPAQTVYLPVDPYVDDPYGRPPAHAAIGAILFWQDVMRDLRRSLHMNAYGRLDVKVLSEAIKAAAPPETQEDDVALRNFVNKAITDIQNAYASMEPDDSLIHLDTVEIKSVDSSGKTLQMSPMLRAIEVLIIRGLKMLPTLMGGVESRGAAGLGSLEYQVITSSVGVFQRLSTAAIVFACELHLRLSGHPARVLFEYEPIRTTDRLKDAQAEALEIQNEVRKRDEGFIDQREASISLTGHEPSAPDRIRGGPALSTSDRPSPPPLPTNQQNPSDGTDPNAKQPSVGETTGEPGDQAGAPKPAPARAG